jgi:hypothetical protein
MGRITIGLDVGNLIGGHQVELAFARFRLLEKMLRLHRDQAALFREHHIASYDRLLPEAIAYGQQADTHESGNEQAKQMS